MQFSQIIDQQATKSRLVQLYRQNRLSHALLFLGREGTGALAMARAFAQFIVCEKVNGKIQPQAAAASLFGDAEPEPVAADPNAEDSCGVCAACSKAAQLVHPDIHFSYPVITRKTGDKPISTDFIKEWRLFQQKNPYGNNFEWIQFIGEENKITGAENKQGNITAHECNDIVRKISLKSFEAEYKILILWMPELLGKEGNKLLKIIEEPPPNTLFILVAENESAVLPTILSRLQLIKLPPLPTKSIEASLALREGVPLQKAEQIALLSEGNYHEALDLLRHSDDDWEVLLRDWMNSIIKSGPAAQVKWIEEIAKIGREKQKQFLLYFIQLLEHAIRLRNIGDSTQNNTDGLQAGMNDFAGRLNKLCQHAQQEAIIHELDQACYQVERNANAKILFHALTIRLYHIISNKSVILVR